MIFCWQGHKKVVGLFYTYSFYEVLNYLITQIRKAHDATRERFMLIFLSEIYEIVQVS